MKGGNLSELLRFFLFSQEASISAHDNIQDICINNISSSYKVCITDIKSAKIVIPINLNL